MVASYPNIVIDDDGTVLIATTRYKVEHLAAENYSYGWTVEDLLLQLPTYAPKRSRRR